MKTIMKLTCAAFAVVTLGVGALTASSVPADNPTARPTPPPRPRPPALFASVNDGIVYKYPLSGVQNTFAAGLGAARGVAFDSAGNLFVANFFCDDTSCHTDITKITADGVQTLFATIPNRVLEGLAIDGANNVFGITFGGVVLKFTPNGVQSTFASSVGDFSYGLEFDSAGNLYTTVNFDSGASQIWKYLPNGTPSLFATASSALYIYDDLAFDRFGNLYVSTQSGAQQPDTILKYAPDGTESTFATGLSTPFGLAFDNAGNLFVAEQFLPGTLNLPGDILKFTPAGIRSVFASGIYSRLEWLAFSRIPAP